MPKPKRQKLKLYLWEGVLTDYTDGIAFAFASSPERAVKQLLKEGLNENHVRGIKVDGVEPVVINKTFATYLHGGG